MKLLLSAVSILVCAGCSSLPHQTIIIKDERGKPLAGAAVGPYPVTLLPFGPGSRGNLTDSRGRVEIYEITPGRRYTLSAVGFRRRQIAFPKRDNTTYVLEREN